MDTDALQALIAGFPDSAVVMVGDVRILLARLAEVEAERDAAKAEAAAALESLTALAPSSLGAQLARAEAELEAARPVVEAAVAVNWPDVRACVLAVSEDEREPQRYHDAYVEALAQVEAFAAAVDLYHSATGDHQPDDLDIHLAERLADPAFAAAYRAAQAHAEPTHRHQSTTEEKP